MYQVKIVSHVYSFGKLRGSESYCFTVSHFGSYFVPICEVTEIAVVTRMSFVAGIDTFMVFPLSTVACLAITCIVSVDLPVISDNLQTVITYQSLADF